MYAIRSYYVMAFATGDQMDSSRVAGYIRNMATPASTWIWAYPLSEFPGSSA